MESHVETVVIIMCYTLSLMLRLETVVIIY